MLGSFFKKVKNSFQRGDKPTSSEPSKPLDKKVKNKAPGPNPKKSPANKKKHRPVKSKKDTKKSSWTLNDFQVEPQEGKTRFHDFKLDLRLMHGIADQNFKYCSPIQALSLPHALEGKDILGKAQTGTGKTAAFLIAIIEQVLRKSYQERYASEPLALILAPTRELVLQIGKDAKALTQHTPIRVMTVVGGMDFQKQQEMLRHEIVDILVATPGRLLDFMNKRDVFLDQTETLVIDEADRMLDMGFIPDVRRIIQKTPPKEERQTLLFSATFNYDVLSLSDHWTSQAISLEVEAEQVTTANVEQKVYWVSETDKFKLLLNVLREHEDGRVIVFANRRDIVRRVSERLMRAGVPCALLSGEVNQQKRIKTLENFRAGHKKVLIATDVAGRGIHVDNVSLVVNYTLPEDPEDYVHRIGRTGRAGAKGMSISLAGEDDSFILPDIEKYIGVKLNASHPPEELLKKKF